MKGFGFSLTPGTSLRENTSGYFLVSQKPVRILRLNRSLFRLIEYIQTGGELSEFVIQNPGQQITSLLKILLSLVANGYLKLNRIAEIDSYPRVSIIIPVRDQSGDIIECLRSLSDLNYPNDQLEIIVVDDGSQKKVATVISSSTVRVIRQEKSLGPAACRNIGAENAHGDILAFLDADCMAGKDWLRELIPFFKAVRTGAVGGYIEGYYRKNALDRYEAACSPLNMGNRLLAEADTRSGCYVPTANMLVSREAFTATGGFDASRHVGEDVDFCWRMRKLGYTLFYVPYGRIAHKHRNRLCKMLLRRSIYGTSEPALYRDHRDKQKIFSISIFPGLAFLSLAVSVILMNPYPLMILPLLLILSFLRISAINKKYGIRLPFMQKVNISLRSYMSFLYYAFFHLVRYYLILIICLGIFWHPLWVFSVLIIIYASIVDYDVKKPRLQYPFFFFFYLSEHLAYQVGVFWSCLKTKRFGSYLISFKRAKGMA